MDKSKIGIVAVAVVILVAVVAIALELRSDGPAGSAKMSNYSDDDGQTYFSDSIFKFPPFDHNGKQAVRASVFSCNKGNFVGFLVRYTSTGLKVLSDAYAKAQQPGGSMQNVEDMLDSRDFAFGQTEVKLPGPQNSWMSPSQFSLSMVKSPDGSQPVPVHP